MNHKRIVLILFMLIGLTSLMIHGSAQQQSDLELRVLDYPQFARAGEEIEYQLEVENLGPDPASEINLQAEFPTEVEISQITADGWICDSDIREVTVDEVLFENLILSCSSESMGVNQITPMEITLSYASDLQVQSEVAGIFSVSSSNADPNSLNNEFASAIAIGTGQADLAVNLSVANSVILANEQTTIDMKVDNFGPDIAQNVVAEVHLPSGSEWIEAITDDWTCQTQTETINNTETSLENLVISCELAELELGVAPHLSLVVAFSAESEDFLILGSIRSDAFDPAITNDTEYLGFETAQTASDLSVRFDSANQIMPAGQPLVHRVEVENLGPDPAQSVTLTSEVSFEGTLISIDDPNGWDCEQETPDLSDGSPARLRVACTLALLEVGSIQTIAFTFEANESVDDGEYAQTAGIEHEGLDTDLSNNSATFSTSIAMGSADLAVAFASSSGVTREGQSLGIDLNVTNSGSIGAENVVVQFQLPLEPSQSVPGGDGWVCEMDESESLFCSRAELAAAESSQITLEFGSLNSASSEFPALITAAVSSRSFDDHQENDTATYELILVDAIADLRLSLKSDEDLALAGETAHFSIEIANLGPDTSEETAVNVSLPTGFIFSDLDSTGLECTESASDFELSATCNLGALEVNESAEFTIGVIGSFELQTESVFVTASIESATYDSDLVSNLDLAEVPFIAAWADLQVTQSAEVSQSNESVIYTLSLENLGPSMAERITVIDNLPFNATVIRALGDGWNCETDISVGVVSECVLESLSAGEASTLEIEIGVPFSETQAVQNLVLISSETHDPNITNNSLLETVSIN